MKRRRRFDRWRLRHLQPDQPNNLRKLQRLMRRIPLAFRGPEYQPDPHPKFLNANRTR